MVDDEILTLEQVISILKEYDKDSIVVDGFGEGDSYRGYYERVAFNPEKYVSIGSILKHAEKAVGTTYEGYKGGDFRMHKGSLCHVNSYGICSGGDELTEHSLRKRLEYCTKMELIDAINRDKGFAEEEDPNIKCCTCDEVVPADNKDVTRHKFTENDFCSDSCSWKYYY